jgi:hypothetical protein
LEWTIARTWNFSYNIIAATMGFSNFGNACFFLQLFKMEDVSVGLWVGQYGREKHVQYENSARFSQAGCVSDYLTAHYQSPRQMMCLWDTLLTTGVAKCC